MFDHPDYSDVNFVDDVGVVKTLNIELLRAGYAWWYRKYAPEDKALEAAEEDARASHRGLWADPNPIYPSLGVEEGALEHHLVISRSSPDFPPLWLMVIRLSTSPGQGRSTIGMGVGI